MSDVLAARAGSRPGGRSARVRAAVLDATLQILMEQGYGAVTVTEVAQAAGVHPTTVYRRWGGRPQLVADAVQRMSEQAVVMPDEGTLAADLRVLLQEVVHLLGRPDSQAIIRSLAAIPPDLDDEFEVARRAFWRARFDAGATIVDRAIARGELPEQTDPKEVLELLVGPAYLRALLTGAPLDDPLVDASAIRVIRAFTPQ